MVEHVIVPPPDAPQRCETPGCTGARRIGFRLCTQCAPAPSTLPVYANDAAQRIPAAGEDVCAVPTCGWRPHPGSRFCSAEHLAAHTEAGNRLATAMGFDTGAPLSSGIVKFPESIAAPRAEFTPEQRAAIARIAGQVGKGPQLSEETRAALKAAMDNFAAAMTEMGKAARATSLHFHRLRLEAAEQRADELAARRERNR